MRARVAVHRAIAVLAMAGLIASVLVAPAAAAPPTAEDGPAVKRAISDEQRHAVFADAASAEGAMDDPAAGIDLPRLEPWAGATQRETAAEAAAAPLPTQVTTTANPAVGQPGFQGLARPDDPSVDREPASSEIAVGPDHVVQVVNAAISVTDRAGTSSFAASMAGFIDTFGFPELGSSIVWSDPRVVYDSVQGRFLLVVAGFECAAWPDVGSDFGTSFLFIMVSDTIDPTGGWTGGYIFVQDDRYVLSSIGTSSDRFALATDVYSLTGASCSTVPSEPELFFIQWANWYAGGGTFGYDPLPPTYAHPVVAVGSPATSSRTHVIAQSDDGAGGPNVRYLTYTTFVAYPTLMAPQRDVDLSTAGVVAEWVEPPAPQQPGPDTVTTDIDSRALDASWTGSRLLVTSTYGCTPIGDTIVRSCVRLTELNTAGVSATVSPTLRQDMLLAEDGADLYAGGSALTGNGTIVAAWTRSSTATETYASSFAGYQLPGDPLGSFSEPELMAQGQGVYTGEAWGRGTGVAADPQVPSAGWQAGQYVAADATDDWATWISQLRPAGTTYVPITPVRVLDTRSSVGLAGKFTHAVPRTWLVAGIGGIPANAVAVSANVTVTGQEAGGYLSVTPTPVVQPPSSTINFPLGDTRANNLVVPLTNGAVSATYRASSGKRTHLLFDVTGYFLADDSGATFTPFGPTRILDSRSGIGGYNTPFTPKNPRLITVAGAFGIPETATAITGNLTVVGQTGRGFLSVTKTAVATPSTSNLNFPLGDTRANGVFAPLDANGDLYIVLGAATGTTANVLLDVTGYFEPGTDGLRFVPLNPGRILDTRIDRGFDSLSTTEPRSLGLAGRWGVDPDAQAVTGNVTVIDPSVRGYVSVVPDSIGGSPSTSTVNIKPGQTKANGLVTPLDGTGHASWYLVAGVNGWTDVLFDLSGYFE